MDNTNTFTLFMYLFQHKSDTLLWQIILLKYYSISIFKMNQSIRTLHDNGRGILVWCGFLTRKLSSKQIARDHKRKIVLRISDRVFNFNDNNHVFSSLGVVRLVHFFQVLQITLQPNGLIGFSPMFFLVPGSSL